MAWIKAADFADQLGVTSQAVRKAIAEGRLRESVRRDGRAWMVDDQEAAAEWQRNTAPQLQRGRIAQKRQEGEQAQQPVKGGLPTQAQAMALRTAYQAKLLELDLKQRQGELVSAEEMRRLRFDSGRQVRDAVLRIGPQMIGEIAKAAGGLNPDERAEVLLVIQRYLVGALEALADGAGQG